MPDRITDADVAALAQAYPQHAALVREALAGSQNAWEECERILRARPERSLTESQVRLILGVAYTPTERQPATRALFKHRTHYPVGASRIAAREPRRWVIHGPIADVAYWLDLANIEPGEPRLTLADIRALRDEAIDAGDSAMATICGRALADLGPNASREAHEGQAQALDACAEAIARAMRDA